MSPSIPTNCPISSTGPLPRDRWTGTRHAAPSARTSATPATAAQAAAELRELVRLVDDNLGVAVPTSLLEPMLRLVEELSAAASSRPVQHSDPTMVSWVLIQRAADHFVRALAGRHHDLRAAAPIQEALAHARRAVTATLAPPSATDLSPPPCDSRLDTGDTCGLGLAFEPCSGSSPPSCSSVVWEGPSCFGRPPRRSPGDAGGVDTRLSGASDAAVGQRGVELVTATHGCGEHRQHPRRVEPPGS